MIHHVALETRREDAAACAAFYGLLGFEEVEPPASLAQRALWVERRGTQVHIMYVEEPGVPAQGHVAVVLDDYEATVGGLRAAGHEVESRQEHWGSPRAFVRDPAGHRVEIMAFAPA